MNQYKEIAHYLGSAELDKREVAKVTVNLKPDLTVEEAYQVQQEIVLSKLNEGKKSLARKWD